MWQVYRENIASTEHKMLTSRLIYGPYHATTVSIEETGSAFFLEKP